MERQKQLQHAARLLSSTAGAPNVTNSTSAHFSTSHFGAHSSPPGSHYPGPLHASSPMQHGHNRPVTPTGLAPSPTQSQPHQSIGRKDSDAELFLANIGDPEDMNHVLNRNRLRTNSHDGAKAPHIKMFDSTIAADHIASPQLENTPKKKPLVLITVGVRTHCFLAYSLSPGGLLFGSTVSTVPSPKIRLLQEAQASTSSPDLSLSVEILSPRSAFQKAPARIANSSVQINDAV